MQLQSQQEHTQDWASENFPTWERILSPVKGKPFTILEIGSFEGRSTIWFLENILTHEDSRMVCIDPWDLEGNVYEKDYNMSDAMEKFKANTEKYSEKIFPIRGFSFSVLCGLHAEKIFPIVPKFGLIYIDGNHETRSVLEDCVLSWPLLDDLGILIFDDYASSNVDNPIREHPKMAIDSFLNTIPGQYQILWCQYQLIIQKISS